MMVVVYNIVHLPTANHKQPMRGERGAFYVKHIPGIDT